MAATSRTTTRLDGGQVLISYTYNDATRVMDGIVVENQSANTVWVGIPDGKEATIPPKTNTTVALAVAERKTLEAGRKLGRPYRLAYPWVVK